MAKDIRMPKLGQTMEEGTIVTTLVKVGDTIVDIQEGRNAGAWTAGVLSGALSKEEMEHAGADFVLVGTSVARQKDPEHAVRVLTGVKRQSRKG